MLRNAIRKDVLLNGKQFWGLLPWLAWAAYAVGQDHMGALTAVSGSLVGALMTVSIGAREDKFGAAAVMASLPVPRRTFVQARYLLALVIGAAMLIVVAGMSAVLPWSAQSSAEALDSRTLLLGLAVAAVATAVLMPVTVRFGLVGLIGFFGVLQVTGVGLLLLPARFGGKAALRGAFRATERFFIDLHGSLDAPGTILQVAVVAALAVWMSYRAAVALVDRQEL